MVKSQLARKLLLLEINEIPWRLIDKFKNHQLLPNIKTFFDNSKTYTTILLPISKKISELKTVKGLSKENKKILIDSEELSPWVTWPTFHRGISSSEHKIKFLGQDITTFKGKPIWQEFLDAGCNIGICGSLQSWPPVYPGKEGFYIPDTFAHDENCYPEYIKSLQRFNLDQVQRNGLVIRKEGLLSKELAKFLFSISKFGLTFKTLLKIVTQLINENFNKNYLVRRVGFQSIILWDVFKSLYDIKSPPAISTFFTNHVASIMHRYWHDVFPEDFNNLYKDKKRIHYRTMLFALKIIDDIIRDAMDFCKSNPDIAVVFATGMGQDAIQYTEYEGYSAEIEEVDKLFNVIEINKNEYKMLIAMVPQVALEVPSETVRDKIKKSLSNCITVNLKPLFSVDEMGNTLSITIHNPTAADADAGVFLFTKSEKEKIDIKWDFAGIKIHKLEPTTGYHIPEGILAIYGDGIKSDSSREKIELTKCKSLLMRLAFGDSI